MNWGERRKLFSSMATSFGMDPLIPETWYNIKRDLIASHWVLLLLAFLLPTLLTFYFFSPPLFYFGLTLPSRVYDLCWRVTRAT